MNAHCAHAVHEADVITTYRKLCSAVLSTGAEEKEPRGGKGNTTATIMISKADGELRA